jgi:hypothetical protein
MASGSAPTNITSGDWVINANTLFSPDSGSATGTLSGDWNCLGTVTLPSHAVRTTTVNLGANKLKCSSFTISALGAATTFNAQTGKIVCGGNFNPSAGTWTPGTSQVVLTGTSTVTLAGGQTFYDLIVRNKSVVTLASAVTVSNVYACKGEMKLNSQTLTISGIDYSNRIIRKNLYRLKRRRFNAIDSFDLANVERAV